MINFTSTINKYEQLLIIHKLQEARYEHILISQEKLQVTLNLASSSQVR